MAERSQPTYASEVRDTIVKYGLTGMAATALAVTVFSPAGFGGMIGTSLASSFGRDSASAATEDAYSRLPAYPSPLSSEEINTIETRLAQTAVSLEITRAATDDNIEQLRSLSVSSELVTFAQAPARAAVQARAVRANEDLRLSLTEPVSAPAPTSAPAQAQPVSYSGSSSFDHSVPYRDPHLELADLLLAHEEF